MKDFVSVCLQKDKSQVTLVNITWCAKGKWKAGKGA